MVVLGLGSNLGDKLANLRRALRLIRQIPTLTVLKISAVYSSDALLPDTAPSAWHKPYFNLAIRCSVALTPHALLTHLKTIEYTIMGRKPDQRWAPRIIDIDILAWDDNVINDDKLRIPHPGLEQRPFALWPLADVAPRWVQPLPGQQQGLTASAMVAPWGSRFTGQKAPFKTRQTPYHIDYPQLVGILNITPDSFSDGRDYYDSTAVAHACQMVEQGAEIIDIGAEATNPNARPISAHDEWQRLEPVLLNLKEAGSTLLIQPKISVDTRHADVAAKALQLGVDWINDVSGLQDPAMRDVVQTAGSTLVLMHSLGVPVNPAITLPAASDPVAHVLAWAEQQLHTLSKHGFDTAKIIFDVGIGFGKTAAQNIELLERIAEFHTLGLPLLVGHSRKSFMHLFTPHNAAERDHETLALSWHLAREHVDYLRVHAIDPCTRSFKAASAVDCLGKT